MPLIQPIAAPTPVRSVHSGDTQDNRSSQAATMSHAPLTAKYNETGDKAVEPAAPPSALQLQIKAIISEQAQTMENDADTSHEELS